MNKKFKILTVSIIVFMIFGIQISKAVATNKESFFYTNKQEISQGDILEMTLDISKIKYNEFEFKLSSNLDINNIEINEEIDTKNYNNDITINIDKSKVNLDKITFYYQVPKDSPIGTKIELEAQLSLMKTTETEENEFEVVENKKININIIEEKQTDSQEKPNDKVDKENITKEQEETNKLEKNEKQNNEILKTSEYISENKSTPNSKSQNANYSANNTNINSALSSTTETAIYNGSNNNYLLNLEIEGENLNTTFNKENTTYFVKTSGKTEVNVNSIAEDSNAKIYVTGNKNLKTGNNKILISVTAENGNVRYYRVFVTNN